MIRMSVDVPLDLAEQVALEHAIHSVLDPHGRDEWSISFVPFLLLPGCVLEVALGHRSLERRVLDTVSAREVERVLRQVVSRSRGGKACAHRA